MSLTHAELVDLREQIAKCPVDGPGAAARRTMTALLDTIDALQQEVGHADALAECLDVVLAMDTGGCSFHPGEHYCECSYEDEKQADNARVLTKAKGTLAAHRQRRAS